MPLTSPLDLPQDEPYSKHEHFHLLRVWMIPVFPMTKGTLEYRLWLL